ncbi:porin [Hydrogenophaga sp.]|uniref:porin n=1 Tax=Hydrogenophaga sp. TaxID=1904254 RepID=UPI002734ECF8|nr:porin [Hydrogenophaga sp.]MDP3886460.1 porin [Hydrogenophaga sp.]
MKKSLVALAALTLVGAASAQSTVVLSGKLGFAYTTSEAAGAAPAKANGLGVTDGDFVLTASEDLGSGLKATASMAVQSRGRDTGISGRDASLTLAGGFGSVMIGAIELGNGIIGLGGADAPTMGLDGATGLGGISRAVLSDVMNMDVLMYTSPDMGGLTVSAAMMDAPGAGGMQSTAATQDAVLVGVNYAAGVIAAAADYTKFGMNNAPAPGFDKRVRLSASYDLGMVKLGAGYENLQTTAAANNDETQYLIGVSAPVGNAVTVGLNYVRNRKDADNTITAYELGANYALSKRTGVQAAYQSISEDNVAGRATALRVRLLHSF